MCGKSGIEGFLFVFAKPVSRECNNRYLHATFAHRAYNDLGADTDTETVLARDPATTPMEARTLGHGHMVVDQRPGAGGVGECRVWSW